MPVSTAHPDYNDAVEVWQQLRDVIAGARAVKQQASKYLPRLSKMTDEDYDAFQKRANFFDGTSRASDAMMGFLFRKAPKVNLPEGNDILDQFQIDATMTGKSLYDLVKDCSRKVCEYGRGGVWMDWSEEEGRPFAIAYDPWDIINWQYERMDGRMMLTRLVLCEYDSTYIDLNDGEKPPDKYSHKMYKQWREFELLSDKQENPSYYVVVSVWRKKKSKSNIPQPSPTFGSKMIGALIGTGPATGATYGDDDYVKIATYNPERGGTPINQILFTFLGTDGPYPEISKPPLLGMSDMNLSWYRTSADYENGLHFLGVPTPYACGFTQDGKPASLTLGSSRVWMTSNESARAGYLEVTSDFSALKNALMDKKAQMAELGVQMLADQSADQSPEAYATVALRQSAQSSNLTAISRALTQCMTDVITMAAWWVMDAEDPQDLQEDINVMVNLDFMGETMTAADASTFMQMMIQGGISYETFFKLLQEGELIEDGLTVEEEQKRIKAGKNVLFAPVEPGTPQPAAGQPLKKGAPPPSQGNV